MPSESIETDTHILVTVPCRTDNYAFLLQEKASGATALIDLPEAAPIIAELKARGWTLDQIWITHHHPDHVEGLDGVLAEHKAPVYGAAADTHRLPPLDVELKDGDTFRLGGTDVHVHDVSGHTIGHIAFHAPAAGAAFTADSLMALGCGRLFEGTPAQMHASLAKTNDWPAQTLICSGHEYTAANAAFALSVDPDNAALRQRAADIETARAAGRFTVPSSLALERATNPFLRAHDPAIRAKLDLQEADDTEVFARVRALKDSF